MKGTSQTVLIHRSNSTTLLVGSVSVTSTTQNMALSDTSFSLHCNTSCVLSASLREGTFTSAVRSISFLGVFFYKTLYPSASILYHSASFLRSEIFLGTGKLFGQAHNTFRLHLECFQTLFFLIWGFNSPVASFIHLL